MTIISMYKHACCGKIGYYPTYNLYLRDHVLGRIQLGNGSNQYRGILYLCHEMSNNVYQEYKTTKHYANSTGVRATCPDCHVPKEWFHKVVRKVSAPNELFHKLLGSVDTPEKFNRKRLALANTVWASMRATNSRECRNCHNFSHMDFDSQSIAAKTIHQLSVQWNKTCIDCHQGVAHTLPKEFDKEAALNEQHGRMEAANIDCVICHQGMATAPADDGWTN